MKELEPQVIFELQDLATDRRLLDAVGHLPHGLADAAVLGNVIEKFQMVNVHKMSYAAASRWRRRRALRSWSIKRFPRSRTKSSA